MFDNKFDQYRPEVCPEIEKQCNKVYWVSVEVDYILKILIIIVDLFYRAYNIVNLITYFRAFLNILTSIC